MSLSNKYELEMVIKEGTYQHPCNHNKLYVQTSIDGVVDEQDNTELVKIENGRVVWNKHISKTFSTLEPSTPVMVSMSMYKKKHFQKGFKLIGTAHFSISELFPILNKPTVQGKIQLNMKKHSPATSTFLLALTLKSSSPPSPASSSSSRAATRFPFSAVSSVGDDEKAESVEADGSGLAVAQAVYVHSKTEVSTPQVSFSSLLGHLKVLLFFMIVAQMLCSTVQLVVEQ